MGELGKKLDGDTLQTFVELFFNNVAGTFTRIQFNLIIDTHDSGEFFLILRNHLEKYQSGAPENKRLMKTFLK